jgi:hypothetical protein
MSPELLHQFVNASFDFVDDFNDSVTAPALICG